MVKSARINNARQADRRKLKGVENGERRLPAFADFLSADGTPRVNWE